MAALVVSLAALVVSLAALVVSLAALVVSLAALVVSLVVLPDLEALPEELLPESSDEKSLSRLLVSMPSVWLVKEALNVLPA